MKTLPLVFEYCVDLDTGVWITECYLSETKQDIRYIKYDDAITGVTCMISMDNTSISPAPG